MHLHISHRQPLHAEIDVLNRPIFPQLLQFSLPLAVMGILQLLFNAADIAVVGQFVGGTALAAVGATSALIYLIVGLSNGVAVGTNILMARHVGSGDRERAERCAHTAPLLGLLMGVLIMVIGLTLSEPLLRANDTPEDILPQSALYLRVYFLGMPATIMYNFCAATLRAIGDTRHPTLFLTAAGVLNIALNVFTVVVLHMGVEGVALATTVSNVLALVLILRFQSHTDTVCRIRIRRLRIDRAEACEILRIGLPTGIQSMLFGLSNVLIQGAVNSFGSAVVAGSTAANSLMNFIQAAVDAIFHGVVTFASQCYGAKKLSRMKNILGSGVGLCLLFGVPMAFGAYLFGRTLLTIYVSPADPDFEAIAQAAMTRLAWNGLAYALCGIMDVLSGMVRGLGRSVLPTVVTLTGVCLFRIVWLNTAFAAMPTLECLFVSYPISWTLTILAHLICYAAIMKKLRRVRVRAIT